MRKFVYFVLILVFLIPILSIVSCKAPAREPSERPTVIEFYSAT